MKIADMHGDSIFQMLYNRRNGMDCELAKNDMHLDIEKMQKAAKDFEGKHDFSAFMAAGGSQKTTVRTIRECVVRKSSEWDEQIEIEVEADAFLYNMVRIIAGTLVEVGCGRIDGESIPEIIKSADRRRAGMTAPPQGLFLKKVIY